MTTVLRTCRRRWRPRGYRIKCCGDAAVDLLVGRCFRTGASIRIGYAHLDSLLTYPDRHNLSTSSQPIPIVTTYPHRHNLSTSLGTAARFLHIRSRQLGSSGGFALLGAFGECVVGVSEAHVVQNPHMTLPSPRKFLLLCGVTPFREHDTPSELVQCSRTGAMLPNRCSAL